jgi:cystathionine beta-lyase/cystathionine gamma-synthase
MRRGFTSQYWNRKFLRRPEKCQYQQTLQHSPCRLAESDSQHGAVVPPLHLSSNYTFERFGVKRQYDYTRSEIRRAIHWRTHCVRWKAVQAQL